VIEKIETPAVLEVDVCDTYILPNLPCFIDAVLRISRQPSVAQTVLALRVDMGLFDSLPETPSGVISKIHCAVCGLDFLDILRITIIQEYILPICFCLHAFGGDNVG
jgi:hypothetical protein